LDQPHVAVFDKDKSYGDFAIVRGDTLENLIVADQNIELEIRVNESQTSMTVMAIGGRGGAIFRSGEDAGGILITRMS
jgi:hypothetical protein